MRIRVIILLLFTLCKTFGQRADSLITILKSKKANDTAKVLLLNSIGRELEREGRLAESKKYFNKAIPLADSLRYKFGQAQGYNWMAITLRESGEFVNAVTYQLKSLDYFTELKDTFGISRGYLTLANIYISMEDYKTALGYFGPALKLALAIKNGSIEVTCHGNMAICFNAIMQLDSAEKYYLKAVDYYIKNNSPWDVATQYGNIGLLKLDQKQPEKALWYLNKALEYQTKINDEPGMASAYNNIGEVYFYKKDYKRALTYFQKGYVLTQKEENKSAVTSAVLSLANCYRMLGDYQNAVIYFEKHLALRDSVLTTGNARSIQEMQTRFETEKKEKEIELLQKDKNIRELQLSEQEANIKRQRILIYSITAGLMVVSVLVFLIGKSYREKRKINLGLERKNTEISLQKSLIEEKNVQITDSIDYAKSIQQAVLPSEALIKKTFPESFIYFSPKDIVSGDFYWLYEKNEQALFAVVDCTGHGVPGAFMSVMAYNMLEGLVAQDDLLQPASILNRLNTAVLQNLGQESTTASAKYGMDISLISFDRATRKLQFAGAHNPLLLISPNGRVTEYKADKTTIGMAQQKFTNHEILPEPGDMLYMFTDGYADQKGGPENRKYFFSEFRKLLLTLGQLDPAMQKVKLENVFNSWRGEKDQIDDILIVGIKI